MKPTPAPTPAAADDDVPAGMLELAPDRIVSGPWFRTRGARAAFACELLPAMDAGPYALVAPDVAVQLRLETRDQVGVGDGAAEGAGVTLLPESALGHWTLRGMGLQVAEYAGLRDQVRFVCSVSRAPGSATAPLPPLRLRMLRAAWNPASQRVVWATGWIPLAPDRQTPWGVPLDLPPLRHIERHTHESADGHWVHFTWALQSGGWRCASCG